MRAAALDSFVGAVGAAPGLDPTARSELVSAAVTALGNGVRLASVWGAVVAALGVLVAVTLVPRRRHPEHT